RALLEDQRGGQSRQPQAAIRLAQVQAQITLSSGTADDLDGKIMIAVPVGGVWSQFVAGKGAGAVDQEGLFVTRFEVHGGLTELMGSRTRNARRDSMSTARFRRYLQFVFCTGLHRERMVALPICVT